MEALGEVNYAVQDTQLESARARILKTSWPESTAACPTTSARHSPSPEFVPKPVALSEHSELCYILNEHKDPSETGTPACHPPYPQLCALSSIPDQDSNKSSWLHYQTSP